MVRFYRFVARLLLPRAFLEEYGSELEQSVTSRVSRSAGSVGRAFVLGLELFDLVRTAVRERRSEWLERRRKTRPGVIGVGMSGSRGNLIESLRGDAHHAWRQLCRAPGFHVAVILTLALGIGLNTAVFSGVWALLFRQPVGIDDADGLVEMYRTWPEIAYGPNSIPHYNDLNERGATIFDGVAAWSFVSVGLSSSDASDVVVGQMVSANFFEVLGTRMRLGRPFHPEESEGVGAHAVVVLSHDMWRSRFNEDPRVIGRVLSINGREFEVIGVAPEGFRGVRAVYAPALWAPLSMQPVLQPGRADRLENRNSNFLNVVARLGEGESIETARAGVQALLEGLKREYPDVYDGTGIRVVAGVGAGAPPSWGRRPHQLAALLMAIVSLLMILACINVANMLLARAEQRRQEFAIRLGIGASRGRIVRQLVTESISFALVAGLAGLALARVTLHVLDRVRLPGALPIDVHLELSTPVLVFNLVLAVTTPIVFGLAPAFRASQIETGGGIGRTASAAFRGSRMMSALVVAQTTLAVVILLSAGLFLRSLLAATHIDPGFDPMGLVTARAHPGLAGLERAETEGFTRRLAERLDANSMVASVTWADVLPLSDSDQSTRISVPGHVPAPGEQMSIGYARVGPRYFETMGIPLLEGRSLSESDGSSSEPVVVINRAMADRFWPGVNAIGRIVETQGAQRRIVGIVPNGRYRTLSERSVPFMYLALAQDFRSDVMLLVRATGETSAVVPALLASAREIDATVPVRDVRTMRDRMGVALFSSRIAAGILGLFGVLGLLLSTIGTYGVIAHVVSRQTREIGIRMALGAHPASVLRGILESGARLVLTGTVTGILLAIVVAVVVRHLLHLPQPVDLITFTVVPLVLVVVALFATAIPARRAARIHPILALKSD